MKRCTKCKQDKNESEFYRDATKNDGLHSLCKTCSKKNTHRWYRKNRQKVAELSKEWRNNNSIKHKKLCKQQHDKIREEWLKILKDIDFDNCYICGYNRCFDAIDFHHPDPSIKKHIAGVLFQKRPNPESIIEVKSMIPLCANCHRELHAGINNGEINAYQ